MKLLCQKQFGVSSEKSKRDDQEQLNLFNEAEAERQVLVVELDVENISYHAKKANAEKPLRICR
ncbi:IS66 family transposase [Sporomusa ovata]|uniref:IS66 family transposase n=1 Tax=Sporomusa ovata TaxID=2378 RepID=UPI0009DBA193